MNSSYIKKSNIKTGKELSFTDIPYIVCRFSCIVLIVYYCWYVEAFGNFSLVVNGSFLLMSGCIFLIHLVDSEIRFNEIPYGIWNKAVVIVYCLIPGLLIASNRLTLLDAVKHFIIFFVITYAFVLVSNHYDSINWLFISIIVSVMICCIHLMFFGYHYSANRIVLSSNSNPNILVTILDLGLFCILYRVKINFKSLLSAVPLIVILTYNIIMTGSRKGFLAALMIYVFWGLAMLIQIHKNGNQQQIAFIWVLLVFVAILFIFIFFRYVVNTELMSRMKTMGNEKSNSARIEMYKEAFKIFLNKPLLGAGLDQYQFWSALGGYSHSTYAEAIADFGFVGCILYFAPFFYTMYLLVRLISNGYEFFRSLFLLGLCFVELFLGIGQIWFYEAGHIFTWALIFICTQKLCVSQNENYKHSAGKVCKYVKL